MTKNNKTKDFGDELYLLMKKHNIPMENVENIFLT